MGASSWIYYTPYQKNLEQAFQALRQHVFETDDYHHFWQMHDYDEYEGLVDIEGKEIFPSTPPPQTIEEVLKRSQPEGTHSILDIHQLISDTRYYGEVPLDEELIQDIFEGTRPTKAMVETIVFQERIWSRLEGKLEAMRMSRVKGYKGGRISQFSEQTLQFFATHPPKEEVVELLLAQEEIWMGIHRCLYLVIEQMALWTRHGTAMPFSSEDLLRLFGSARPTKSAVEAACKQREIWSHGHVGVGYYAIIYQDDAPHEIVFVGSSGD